jgi:hypothetical protein
MASRRPVTILGTTSASVACTKTGHKPRPFTLDSTIPTVASAGPTVTIISPLAGTPVGRSTPFVITVTSPLAIRRILLRAEYGGITLWELAHDGTTFGPAYQGGTNGRLVITDGYQFTLLRDGGWPGTPIITAYAIDAAGQES